MRLLSGGTARVRCRRILPNAAPVGYVADATAIAQTIVNLIESARSSIVVDTCSPATGRPTELHAGRVSVRALCRKLARRPKASLAGSRHHRPARHPDRRRPAVRPEAATDRSRATCSSPPGSRSCTQISSRRRSIRNRGLRAARVFTMVAIARSSRSPTVVRSSAGRPGTTSKTVAGTSSSTRARGRR